MTTTHNATIDINIVREAIPAAGAGFGRVAVFQEGPTYSDDTQLYTSVEEINTAEAAGELTSDNAEALKQALNQLQQPEDVLSVKVGGSTAADYETAFDALIASGDDFYGVTMQDKTTSANHSALGVKVEESSKRAIFFLESDDATWLVDALQADGSYDQTTAGTPFESIAAGGVSDGPYLDLFRNERTAVVYHDPAPSEDYASEAWAGYRLSYDPDVTTPSFTAELLNVTPDSSLSASEKASIEDNNANVILSYYQAQARLLEGINLAGRPLTEILAGDWLEARVKERLATLALNVDRRGELIPVNEGDTTGQDLVISEAVAPVLELGVANGKFLEDFTITRPTITAADVTAKRVPVNVDVRLTNGAIRFRLNFYLSL